MTPDAINKKNREVPGGITGILNDEVCIVLKKSLNEKRLKNRY